ncbi:hypothetical protein B0H14DRAFT_273188 [Mycena olivaceomarginata]|nr:hypothetical protein B0H14DRAFT_273188 [Mycena olivaceomarginata]
MTPPESPQPRLSKALQLRVTQPLQSLLGLQLLHHLTSIRVELQLPPPLATPALNNLAPVPAGVSEAPGPAPQASTAASNIPTPVPAGLTLDVGNAAPGPSPVATAAPGTIAPTTLSVAPDVVVPPAPTPVVSVSGGAGPTPLVISATTPVDTPPER